jgi:hypothetical protein
VRPNSPVPAATASSTAPPASISMAAASIAWLGSASRWPSTDPNPHAAAAPSTISIPDMRPDAVPPTRITTPASPTSRPPADRQVTR